MVAGASLEELLEGHVALQIDCLDRLYLNAYVPKLQVSGQVVSFLTAHRGNPIPSPALFAQIGHRFRAEVAGFAERHAIPLIRFAKHERQIERMRPWLRRAEAEGRPGVVAIGIAQEFQRVFVGADRGPADGGPPRFAFARTERRVTTFYFYIWDDDFGPAFIKICSYFPYPAKVWVNGHEWAKRQATKAGLDFSALSNGFAACADPARLQAICDALGPSQILAFFERWLRVIPLPLSPADRLAGYWWELSMRQVEVSRTIVFDAPRHARACVEAIIRDNLGLGRPHEVELIFTGRHERRGRPPATRPTYKTKVVTRGVDVTVNAFYKHSRIKQYLKDGRALRIETVINGPGDLGVKRRLPHLGELQARARAVNRRILIVQRAGQGCAIGPTLFERIQQPYVREGQRTGALRFGDPRAMALAGSLCLTLHAVTGVTNRSLRALIAGLLGTSYSASQMTYDLRRLRLHGLIRRLERRHRYVLTDSGLRFAVFYTKLGDRLLPPLFAIDQPNSPPELRRALDLIAGCITRSAREAGIAVA